MPQALPGFQCLQLCRLSRTTTASARGPKEAGMTRMTMLRIITMPSHAPAARVVPPQALPGIQCLHVRCLSGTSSERVEEVKEIGKTGMSMLRNLTKPNHAPAARLQPPQALPGLIIKRLPNPTALPLLRRNAKQRTHIDFGLTESIRNVLGSGKLETTRLRTLILFTQMTSSSVAGMSCLRGHHELSARA